jgi:hypothetical protein
MSEFTKIVGSEDGSLGTPDIYVPEQCMSCPKIIEKLNDLEEYRKIVNELLEMAFSDDEVTLVNKATGEVLDKDQSTKIVCKMAASGMDELDENIAKAQRDIYALTNGCAGPLGLQASDGDRCVSIYMCDSPEVFYLSLGEAQIGEPVIIQRYLKKNED